MLFSKMNAKEFLVNMVTDQKVTVDANELRELLQIRSSLEREVKRLRKENEILKERNSMLRDIIESYENEKLEVTGINTYA